jgi:hypothetical protein
VQLSSASFNRFTLVTPAGAPGPVLANNPFIGPNPVAALEPGAPADNTPKVKVKMDGLNAQGSFLLDTGAAVSMISNTVAQQLHIYHQDPNDLSSPLVFDAPGAGSQLVPNQFQLTVTGVGSETEVTRQGFYLDYLTLPTVEAHGHDLDPRNVVFRHVPVLVNDITVQDPSVSAAKLTLDGVFGMNLMTATQSVDFDNLDWSRGAFDFTTFDQPHNMLNLSLNSDFHIAGDFDMDGLLTNADMQAMLAAMKNPDAFEAAHGFSDDDWYSIADINQDGNVDNYDFNSLMSLLVGGDVVQNPNLDFAVPEPASVVMAAIGAIGVGVAVLKRRRHS